MDGLHVLPAEIDEITSICNSNFQFHLLFKEKPQRPSTKKITDALGKEFGDVSVVMDSEELSVYSLEEVASPNLDGRMKVKVIMTDVFPFEGANVLIGVSNEEQKEKFMEQLDQIQYCMLVTDMLASSLSCNQRCRVLVGWLKCILEVFEGVEYVWIPSARKVLAADKLKKCSEKEILEKLFLGITVQVFSTEEEDEFVVITKGLEALSKDNYMYVFRNIGREVVVEYAYQMASNLLENGQILEAFDDFSKITYDKIPPYDTRSKSLIRVFTI